MASQLLRDDLASIYGVDLPQNISTPSGTPALKRRKLSLSARSSQAQSSSLRNSQKSKLQSSFKSTPASPVLNGVVSGRKRNHSKLTSPAIVKRNLSLSVEEKSKSPTPDGYKSPSVSFQEALSEDIFANSQQLDTPPNVRVRDHGKVHSTPISGNDGESSSDKGVKSLIGSMGEMDLDKSDSTSNKETKTEGPTRDKGEEVLNAPESSIICSSIGEEALLMNDTMTFSMMERLAQEATTEVSASAENKSSEDIFNSQARKSTSFHEARLVD